ncbi:hypothetical protein HWV62_29569 [Athelia sp. TMB]|nr:hypothetical protein HWV62_29569 [Athelia sp. TMB]
MDVSAEQLKQDLSKDFIDPADDDLLQECVKLCHMFNLSADDLRWKWEAISFNATRSIKFFDIESCSMIREQMQREKATELAKLKKASIPSRSQIGPGRGGRPGAFTKRPSGKDALSGPLKVGLTSSSRLMASLGSDDKNSVAGPSKVTFRGPKDDEASKKQRAYRYMYEKVSERSEILDERIDEFAELLRDLYKIPDLGDPAAATEEATVIVGRICLDSESSSQNVKLNEASLVIESSRMWGSGARVQLKFEPSVKVRGGPAGVGGVQWFPGAIVGLKGKNGGGGCFLVEEILTLPRLAYSPASLGTGVKPEPQDTSFSMFIAGGPFTPDTDLNYAPFKMLFKTLLLRKPDVVLLIGPFVDSAHPFVRDGEIDSSPADIFLENFSTQLQAFLDLSPRSLVLLVPSVRDVIHNHAVFPQSEFHPEYAGDRRIRLLSNPCRFTLNDVSFGITSVDVLFHLQKEKFFKPALELDPVVDSTVAINPSFLTKGFYSILSYHGHGPGARKEQINELTPSQSLPDIRLQAPITAELIMSNAEKHSSKPKRSRDKDGDKKSKKRHKNDDEEQKSKKRKRKDETKLRITDDDPDDEDMWVEKNIDMDGTKVLATDIPTAASLSITSTSIAGPSDPSLPPAGSTETSLKRDDWMLMPASNVTGSADGHRERVYPGNESLTEDYGEPGAIPPNSTGGVDFFSSLGTEVKKRKNILDRPQTVAPKMSAMVLNPDAANTIDHDAPPPPTKPTTPGGPGSQWRMMRLRRVFETAEEEGTPVEELAIERFGSLQAFEDAKEERRVLDEREGKRSAGSNRGEPDQKGKGREQHGMKGFMFNDVNGDGNMSRSSSFRRPMTNAERSAPSTPSPGAPQNRRLDSLRLPSQAASPLNHSHTPIPSVMTPYMTTPNATSSGRAMSPSSLNKLQAKVLRAKLMNAPNADTLEREYDEAIQASQAGVASGVRTQVEVLPTLDVQGRMYDVGHGKDDGQALPGNRKKKEEKFETRDPKTGDIIRYNADDDTTTLGEMLRQERMGAGMADQKELDAQFAQAIMGDGKFQNDLDYIDDNAEKLGRQKMRSDAMKRQFAVHDYKRTQKAMSSCAFCFAEDDSPPKAPVVAMGTRVYLACTTNEELVDGHCLIVPIQHHLTMLEGDDDVWDEVKNFMKCLMRMFAAEDKGVVFYETVITLKYQRHTFIECVPMPWEQYELIPQYFKESILSSEAEWSQHKKLINFSSRPGGFRRAMVPNLPYFMVQFDHKGEKGYGHVIEGTGESAGQGEDDEGADEGGKGGGEFPSYFAAEIIGNVLETEPRRWRRPRKIEFRSNKERVAKFKQKYNAFDWTGMIGR